MSDTQSPDPSVSTGSETSSGSMSATNPPLFMEVQGVTIPEDPNLPTSVCSELALFAAATVRQHPCPRNEPWKTMGVCELYDLYGWEKFTDANDCTGKDIVHLEAPERRQQLQAFIKKVQNALQEQETSTELPPPPPPPPPQQLQAEELVLNKDAANESSPPLVDVDGLSPAFHTKLPLPVRQELAAYAVMLVKNPSLQPNPPWLNQPACHAFERSVGDDNSTTERRKQMQDYVKRVMQSVREKGKHEDKKRKGKDKEHANKKTKTVNE